LIKATLPTWPRRTTVLTAPCASDALGAASRPKAKWRRRSRAVAVMIDYKMKAEAGSYKVTGHDANLVHTVIVQTIAKNWWLIALYLIINLASIFVGAYILTIPWLNASVSILVLIFTTWVGYFMMCKVVTVTNEVR
jgi:hypothetical protein